MACKSTKASLLIRSEAFFMSEIWVSNQLAASTANAYSGMILSQI
ncbi:hypothetical protein PSYCG_11170 [Psychrobacter sp. G]|nr:hypothetical protein PSYCG_11170 [Psychrobacter sp. G]